VTPRGVFDCAILHASIAAADAASPFLRGGARPHRSIEEESRRRLSDDTIVDR